MDDKIGRKHILSTHINTARNSLPRTDGFDEERSFLSETEKILADYDVADNDELMEALSKQKSIWHNFDQEKGSSQKLPKERRFVLGEIDSEIAKEGSPNPVVLCYLRYAAGDKQSPQFITPGCRGMGNVIKWCDCLPESFDWDR